MTLRSSRILPSLLFALTLLFAACAEDGSPDSTLSATALADSMTTLSGPPGTDFEGVELQIPAGALPAGTTVTIAHAANTTPLPDRAHSVGKQLRVIADTDLSQAATLTLPFDGDSVSSYGQDLYAVKIWMLIPESNTWQLIEPTSVDTETQQVTIPLDRATIVSPGVKLPD